MTKKQTKNVGMVEGIPSQITLPGGFSIPTEHPAFAEGLAALATALGFAPKGVFYSVQYGLSQSLQDCVAGMTKALQAEGKTEAEITKALHDAMQERLYAIASGEIGHRVRGPQVKGIEKVIRDVAWEAILAAATERNVAGQLPKKVNERAAFVDKYLADKGRVASAKAEAERRMSATAKPDVDLSSLFA